MTAHIYSLVPTEGFTHMTLGGHRDAVLGAWFSKDSKAIYTISKDGALFHWRYASVANILGQEDSDEEMDADKGDDEVAKPADRVRWRVQERHYFMQAGAKVKSCAFHQASNLLVVGFSSGIFGIWELPTFTNIHTLRYVICLDFVYGSMIHTDLQFIYVCLVFHKRRLTQLQSTLQENGWHSAVLSLDNCWYGNGNRNPMFSSSKVISTI
jgi:WD40 repeat protein